MAKTAKIYIGEAAVDGRYMPLGGYHTLRFSLDGGDFTVRIAELEMKIERRGEVGYEIELRRGESRPARLFADGCATWTEVTTISLAVEIGDSRIHAEAEYDFCGERRHFSIECILV